MLVFPRDLVDFLNVTAMSVRDRSAEPGACLVVEDATAGIQAARAAGMDAAAIGDAVACGLATYNLSTFGDLLDCVD